MRPHDRQASFSADPGQTVRDLARAAGALGEVAGAHVWLADTATKTYRQLAWCGAARTECDPIPMDREPFPRAVSDQVGLLTADTGTSRVDPPLSWRFVLPITAGADSGIALVDFWGERPDPAHLGMLGAAFAPRLAAALAVHVAHHEAAAANAVLRASQTLMGIVDSQAVASELLDRAVALARAHTGSVMLYDETANGLRIVSHIGLPSDVVSSTTVTKGDGVAGWVFASGKAVVIEDPADRGSYGRRHGVRSAVCVPIADADGVAGVLSVGMRTYPGRSMGSLLAALESLAALGTAALRNADASACTRRLYFETLEALVSALETKDPFAHGATERVVELTTALGEEFDLSESEAEALRAASLLHDIGMSAAGDVVMVSNRPLSTVEHTLLKMHPVIAADILRQAPALEQVVPIVYHHHERYDGSGYMTGAAGDQIPMGARILAVADAFVAMTSDRPYRKARTSDDALRELKAHAGSQFDPEVVAAFERVLSAR